MGCTRGRIKAGTLQVALPAERRSDRGVGVGCTQSNRHTRRWMGIMSVARHYTKLKQPWKLVERGEQPVPVCGDFGYRLVFGDWSSK